ncbi:PD-(D/E)XK nuclease family protein [candidate division WWE3 bacterium]|uniref:PD-(D/E)XK nuclease family protein n=1 Tax=candidate division WWE3 bacterium TaxID=2053526 RepID=A0A3A4ZFE2_UNCKA|nr:MAG: PD-(D/E)XK nuclease family protein [candidate division WWE3 bacterium]
MLTLSKSGIETYLRCPAQYYFRYIAHVSGKTDYARLCGTVVHNLIARFHKKGNPKNPFYYKNLDTAIKTWGYDWWKALEENSEIMLSRTKAQDWQFYNIGKGCIQKYWDQMFGKPAPLLIEKRRRARIGQVELLGIFDQVREVPNDRIGHWRPDLIDSNGNLLPGYLPQIIMDLKTSTHDYDLRRFNATAELIKMAEYQFPLHEDLQATAYTYLFQEHNNGMLPLGFVFYYLRYGKLMFTYRTPRDYITLKNSIAHIVGNLDNQSFPKRIGKQCTWCDYISVCRGDRDYLLATPVTEMDLMFGAENGNLSGIPTSVEFKKPTQLRMRMIGTRRKKPLKPEQNQQIDVTPHIRTFGSIIELPFFMEGDDEKKDE